MTRAYHPSHVAKLGRGAHRIGCGYPGWTGIVGCARAPLHAFYQEVNKAGLKGMKVLTSANDARASYLKAYMGRAEKQLRSEPVDD